MCVLFIVPMGCSANSYRSTPSFSTGEQALATGDWNDVDAAVSVAASQGEMAVTQRSEPKPGTIRFELKTVTDEPVELIVRRRGDSRGGEQGGIPEGPVVMELSATVGRFGDRKSERRLLRAVSDRLGQLEGVDFRPRGTR